MANIGDHSQLSQRKFWTEFIQLFKENPCLWDAYSTEFGKKNYKDLAMNLLLEKYWELDGSATLDTLKKKIVIFRSGVTREYKKIRDAKVKGKHYVSRLWYYPFFKFLIDSEKGEQPDDAEADDCGRESPQPSSSDVVKDEHDASSLVVLTHNTPASRVNPSPNLVEPVYQSLPKITRVSSIAETQTVRPSFSRTAPISAVIDKVVEDNFEEAQHDDCSTFAAHVNMRMRRFDPTQKVIAQKLISDIMFMADTMQLNLASAVVNPQHQAAQFAKAIHAAQVVHASQGEPVPQATNNGFPNQAIGGSYSAYVLDSDEDSGPLNKKMK